MIKFQTSILFYFIINLLMKIESYIYQKLKLLNALTQINMNNLMKNMDYGLLFSISYSTF